MHNAVTYVDLEDEVIERINYGVSRNDIESIQAKKWADDFFIEKGRLTGLDKHLEMMFNGTCNPNAVRKFVRLK